MSTGDRKLELGRQVLPKRLRKTAEVYASNPRHDGGWGLSLDQPSSLVNTAEVIAVLRIGGIEFDDLCVKNGLTYLTTKLDDHLGDPDRGPRTRYAAFSLLGLTEFPQAREREDVREAIRFATDWLMESNRVAKGWSSKAEPRELSLFATCIAMSALSRTAPGSAAMEEGAECLLDHSLTASTWPAAATRRDRPSPAMTGLAALALFAVGRDKEARAASRWLASKSDLWANRTEEARDELGTPWRHMTFSICARAVLMGGTLFSDPCIRPTLKYLDSLWSPHDALWSDGDPNGHLTVRGAYAVALLLQQLQRNLLAIDPLSLADTISPDGYGLIEVAVTAIALDNESSSLELKVKHGSRQSSCIVQLDPALYKLASLILQLGPIDTRPLAKMMEVTAPDVRTMVAALNHEAWAQTDSEVMKLVHRRSGKGFFIPVDA